MARAAPSASLVITLVGALVVLCGGLVVMVEYGKVKIKERAKGEEPAPAGPAQPFAARLQQLERKEYAVTQLGEDNAPNFGRYVETKAPGTYHDIVSDEAVFSSRDKLEPALGYAEFSKPLDPARLVEERGMIGGEERLNVKGRSSGARLGWIVTGADGSRRYVLNSSALKFVPAPAEPAPVVPPNGTVPVP